MSDLTEFLLARVAEDETVARAATTPPEPGWQSSWDRADWQAIGDAAYLHLSRHDPARVRAECEAKRRIVGEHAEVRHAHYGAPSWEEHPACGTCDGKYPDDWPCPTLRALAAIYADHPDYRDEWRP